MQTPSAVFALLPDTVLDEVEEFMERQKERRKWCPAACVSSNSTSYFLITVSGSQKQERRMLYRTQHKVKSGKFGCGQLEKTITVLSNEQRRLASSSTQRYADIKPQTSHQD